jgi:tetratricopeptide (TPR) repeat protein
LLSELENLMDQNQFSAAISLADDLIAQNDRLPDVLSQRGAAKYQLQDYRAALSDCQRVVELNRFHYIAWVGMGHCYLELSQPLSALDCFRHAVDLYPDLEPVRLQIRRLERAFQDPH